MRVRHQVRHALRHRSEGNVVSARDVASPPLVRLADVDHHRAFASKGNGIGRADLANAAHGADPPSFAPASTSASSGHFASAPVTAPWSTL